ncbi:type I-E CRISPR-associated protein Cas6/Cse3/CasE [Actinacidiphila oryziradicis]|uniref:type I-E CRISPR-associated protein Cas6/Cse3/CasE n=1 Tax=Actinacidiphila oryziradicis TaxID=2571141 RepID=UPI0023F2872A|nr:type I-E CRISPR-associated protein Cas6/Cse3/CasE [Actinacidiphila oryziradicis]MCW2870379.1 hypothetical protein [Actinacidiphila oryziradicis]
MATETRTLHLTRLHLGPRSRTANHDLRDAHLMHRRVMSLYPDQMSDGTRARAELGVLYRIERDHQATTVLIQSPLAPDTAALPADYLATPPQTRNLGPLLDWLTDGATVRYRIDATPTRAIATQDRRPDGKRKPGKRTPLFGADAVAWWDRQARTAGLDPQLILDTPQTPATGNRDGHRVRHSLTRFEGVATITDTTALRATLTTGIGRGRAYGAGLLSLAPITG